MNWQPIETAPLGGEEILVWASWHPTMDSPQCYIAAWDNEAIGEWFDTSYFRPVYPSHWMPLPAPPTEQAP